MLIVASYDQTAVGDRDEMTKKKQLESGRPVQHSLCLTSTIVTN